MASRSVVVFGADYAALAVATRLALDGHSIVLWEPPSAAGPLPAPCDQPRIKLRVAGVEREATLAATTTDPFEALGSADVVLACAAPGGLGAIAELVLPLMESRHTMVLLGGGLHALAAAAWLRDRGRSDLPTLVASDAMPFAGLAFDADRLSVATIAAHVGLGVFPARRSDAAAAVLADLFPGAGVHPHVLAAALAAVEPMVRETALLMNLGAVERRSGGFSLYADGFTEGVARIADALDGERLALAVTLGLSLPTAAQALHAWGVSPVGDLWAAVHGSLALTRTADECASRDGRLAHGGSFGMRFLVELAGQLGVAAPVAGALLALGTAVGNSRLRSDWSLDDVGLAGMTAQALLRFLGTGDDQSA